MAQTFLYPNHLRIHDGQKRSLALVGPMTVKYARGFMEFDLVGADIEPGDVLCMSFRLRMRGVTGDLQRIGIEPLILRSDGSAHRDYLDCWVTPDHCVHEADGSLSYDGLETRTFGPLKFGYSINTNIQPYFYIQPVDRSSFQIAAGGGIYVDHVMVTWGPSEEPHAWAPAEGEVWPE